MNTPLSNILKSKTNVTIQAVANRTGKNAMPITDNRSKKTIQKKEDESITGTSAVIQLCGRKGCKIKGDHVHEDDKEDLSDGEKKEMSFSDDEEKETFAPMPEKDRVTDQSVWSKPVDYKSHYAKFARDLRRRNDSISSGSNINVLKLGPKEGTKKPAYLVTGSRNATKPKDVDRFKPLHSEEIAESLVNKHEVLKERKPEWDYTEREPCGEGPGMRNCRKKTVPKLKLEKGRVFHTFPYPSKDDYINPEDDRDDKKIVKKASEKATDSREKSNDLMSSTVDNVKKRKSDGENSDLSESEYSVYYDSDVAPDDVLSNHVLSMGRRSPKEVERLLKAREKKKKQKEKKREREKNKKKKQSPKKKPKQEVIEEEEQDDVE